LKTDPYSENIEDLYQNAPCGYFSMLPGGMIISINNTLLKWLDYKREEVVYEMMLQDLLRAGGKIYFQTHLMPILQIEKEVSEINMELRGRGSIKIPALINAKKEEDSDGQSFYLFSVLDITQRKLYENELIKARIEAEKKAERLRQVNEELERFANRASHDLQAPLNTLSGIVFLLEKKGLIIENEESEKLLNIIERNTKRMRTMIRDLLEHSKMDSDSADFESVSLNMVCKEVIELLGDEIKNSGADFKISDLPEVKGIKSQLVSLFQNLFSNAIKYRSEKNL
jgi:PAS domain S-box-containing protein